MSDRLCACCGRPIRRRYRESDIAFDKRTMCSTKCALAHYERTQITRRLVLAPSTGFVEGAAP